MPRDHTEIEVEAKRRYLYDAEFKGLVDQAVQQTIFVVPNMPETLVAALREQGIHTASVVLILNEQQDEIFPTNT